jgi:hypothetical protein
MFDWPAYLTGLVITLVLSAIVGLCNPDPREKLWRTASAIALVWALGKLYISNTGNYDPWEFNLFIDSAAMAVILWHPAGRPQAVIGWLYMLQMAYHSYYGSRELLGYSNDVVLYYLALTVIAWSQLLTLGIWCGGIWFQDRLPRLWPNRHSVGHLPARRNSGKAP